MDVEEAIDRRRAYRSLKKVDVDEELIDELGEAARLAPSCFNYQPWRFVFVKSEDKLKEMEEVMSSNNDWTKAASLIVGVFAKKEDDCVVKKEREYYLFDTGMATAFMILRATELGLVAHPIAGYDEEKAKEVMNIPDGYRLITLVNIGEHSDEPNELMTEKQKETEKERPERKPLEEFVFIDEFEGD